MAFVFEARPYGPGSTPEEIRAIEDCVFVHAPGILYWRELPVQSEFQLRIFDERLRALCREWTEYRLLIDLEVATPPGAAVRAGLRKVFQGQEEKLRRIAVFTGKNFMLNVTAKFVLTNAGMRRFTVHRTLAEAEEELAHDLARR